jgi:hypothetical protein
MSDRIQWGRVLERAKVIVESYTTSVTLRQLFYRLVAEQLIPNQQAPYRRLSAVTAEARRRQEFPALIDRGRSIHQPYADRSPADALRTTAEFYRRDRTQGQPVSLYLGVEKAGIASGWQNN